MRLTGRRKSPPVGRTGWKGLGFQITIRAGAGEQALEWKSGRASGRASE